MVTAHILILGLVFGSFVNALVWRLHEQDLLSKQPVIVSKLRNLQTVILNVMKNLFVIINRSLSALGMTTKVKSSVSSTQDRLSIISGRSMCPKCKHELSALDLIPVLSWLMLKGKCRYCRKPISSQYPIVELITGMIFVVSYLYWPLNLVGLINFVLFGLWLSLLVGFMALTIYDLKWMLLPNRLIYPLSLLALIFAALNISSSSSPDTAVIDTLLAVILGGGVFYILFQVSAGKWIGGGDVKLGWLLGLVLATPSKAVFMIFLASSLGTIYSLPLLISGKVKKQSIIPFGPFLIAATFIVVLFGQDIINWYLDSLLIRN